MKVALIASTTVNSEAMNEWYTETDPSVTDPDLLATFAGRACYQSFDRPNPRTRETVDYLAHILEVAHHSVLAHASATFYITGVSRSLTHELVRHRWLAFSQLSQRYVDGGQVGYVEPPAIAEAGTEARNVLADAYGRAVRDYEVLVGVLADGGLPRKQAREAARAVLPNATETRVVVSGNLRAWRDFLAQRLSPTADREIRALAVEILRQLRVLAPGSFQDFQQDDTFGVDR